MSKSAKINFFKLIIFIIFFCLLLFNLSLVKVSAQVLTENDLILIEDINTELARLNELWQNVHKDIDISGIRINVSGFVKAHKEMANNVERKYKLGEITEYEYLEQLDSIREGKIDLIEGRVQQINRRNIAELMKEQIINDNSSLQNMKYEIQARRTGTLDIKLGSVNDKYWELLIEELEKIPVDERPRFMNTFDYLKKKVTGLKPEFDPNFGIPLDISFESNNKVVNQNIIEFKLKPAFQMKSPSVKINSNQISRSMSTAPEIIAAEKFTAEELAKMGKFTKGARFVGKWGGRIIVIVPVVIAGGEAYYQVKDMETGEAIANWAPYTIVNFAQMSDPGQIIRDLSERNKKQTEIRRQKNTAEDRAREIYLQSIQQERINRECAGLTGHDRTACEENIKKGIRAAQTNILQQREQKRIYDASGGAMEEGMREAWGGGLLRRVFGR